MKRIAFSLLLVFNISLAFATGSEWYDHTTYPSVGAAGSSSAMRAELDLIEAGFDKLPTLSGNGSKITAINSGGTAMEAITTTGTGSGVRATSPTLDTPTLNSPTLVTPALGVATATSVNKVAITAPATGATLTLADGSTLATSGANSVTLTTTGATNVTLPTSGTLSTMARGTDVTASGTSVDFTGIPSGVNRITVIFSEMSTNGLSRILIQIGDSGGVEATSYISFSVGSLSPDTVSSSSFTTGFGLNPENLSSAISGTMVLTRITANKWIASGTFANSAGPSLVTCGGNKSLSGTLDRVRITTVNGTDTYDGGTVNILYE